MASTNPQLPNKRRPPRRIGFWIFVAALVHAELVLIVGLCVYALAPRDADLQKQLAERGEGPAIDIGMVDDEAARQIIADLERQEEQRKAEEVKKEIESVKAPGQVVDIPIPRREQRPDEARFASEHDSTVAKETKKYGKFDEKSQQGDATGAPRPRAPQAASEPRTDGRLAMREPTLGRALRGPGSNGPEVKPQLSGSRYGAAPDPGAPATEGNLPQLGGEAPPRRPSGGGPSSSGTTPSLMPTEEQLARAIGGGTQDALKDIDEGDETALNSKKWRFASFFNRVKKQVAEHWHPEEVYRRRDPTGAVYGHQNRYTLVRVQIRPDGTLANVSLEQPSGLEFLDDEAIEAFRQAQPFPNPPRQLIERSGLINFGLGFLLDLNGTTRMRWFRYND